MNRDDVVEALEFIRRHLPKHGALEQHFPTTVMAMRDKVDATLASLSKAQPDTRRAHLDNVRSNMTQGDHNTVPAQPEEGLVGELREHARQSERFGEESTASEDAMSRAADEIERLTALSRNHDEAWQPRIGERVRMTDACPDAELWNKQEWFVAGVKRHVVGGYYTPALDVFVSASWPEISDPTDGFLINQPNAADQIEPCALKGDSK